jgi:predicted ribosome quality control (RQC) complex YloA/Tae2 family protein
MERGLASFDIYVIVSELQDMIGGYIDKVIQSSRDEIILKIKNPQTNEKESLYIRNNELICRTKKQFNALLKPPSFTLTLRKHILNGRIQAITQHEFDRIVTITITKKEESFNLVVELFKNGNIILVNSDGVIIHSLITQRWAARTIKTHEVYQPPPSQKNPFTLDFETFQVLLKNSKQDLVRTLAVTLNLGGLYAEELCTRAHIDKNSDAKTLDQPTMERLYATLVSFLELFNNKDFHPVYVKEGQEIVGLLPFPFESYHDKELVPVEKYSESLDAFIQKKITKNDKKRDDHQKHIEKLQRQLQQQEQSIAEFNNQMKHKQHEGDVIYLHLNECQTILDDIGRVLKQKEKDEDTQRITKNPLVKQFDISSNILVVVLHDTEGNEVQVSLDFRKSAVDNAQQAYEDGKKFKEKIDGAEQAIQETKNIIQKVQSNPIKEDKAEEEHHDSGKRFWFEAYRWSISSEGNVIVAGRDARSNDTVVKKYLKDEDRYAHADVHGAASCVVKGEDIHGNKIPISEQTLQEACLFAACHSKAWKQYGEVQAYWVNPEQVSKTPESGDFLPKGAFIIRGKRNYCRCTMELAIGEITIDDSRKIMAGAESALSVHSQRYVVLQPGTMKPSSLARILAQAFKVSADDILKALPAGDVQIKKNVGVNIPELSQRTV